MPHSSLIALALTNEYGSADPAPCTSKYKLVADTVDGLAPDPACSWPSSGTARSRNRCSHSCFLGRVGEADGGMIAEKPRGARPLRDRPLSFQGYSAPGTGGANGWPNGNAGSPQAAYPQQAPTQQGYQQGGYQQGGAYQQPAPYPPGGQYQPSQQPNQLGQPGIGPTAGAGGGTAGQLQDGRSFLVPSIVVATVGAGYYFFCRSDSRQDSRRNLSEAASSVSDDSDSSSDDKTKSSG